MADGPSAGVTDHQDGSLAGSTVLVTGGTGFTGTHLVRKLVAAGASVRGIARPSSRIPADLESAVTWVRGDVYDPPVVQAAIQDAQYVFHLAACYRDAGASDEEYGRVHVESTRLLAEAAARQPGFQRFVHTSTVGVHGHIEDPPADESAPFAPGDIYQRTKLEGELWIREFAERQGLPLVVIRPAAIMGPGDRRLLKLFKFASIGFFPLLDGHDTLYHLIHVEDLTRCMIVSATHPAAVGEVLICGNEHPTSVVPMLTQMGQLIGRKVRFVRVPGRPLFLVTDVVERVSGWVGIPPILYRRRLEFFTKDRAFDTRRMREVLDFEYRHTNESGIRDTAEGYMAAGWLKGRAAIASNGTGTAGRSN